MSQNKKQLKVQITTGIKAGAGTDATIYFLMQNDNEEESEEFKLDHFLKNNFERETTDIFHIEIDSNFGNIKNIQIRKDTYNFEDTWYLEKILIEDKTTMLIFPVHRWIENGIKYVFKQYDCFLPQFDQHKEQRLNELKRKRQIYQYEDHLEGGIVQSKILPDNEKFTYEDTFEISTETVKSTIGSSAIFLTSGKWNSLDDLKNMYNFLSLQLLKEPQSTKNWSEDYWFGLQRVQGTNANLLKLCQSIPENFGVESSTVESFLNESTLEEAIEAKRIFIINLEILQDIYTKGDDIVCSPLALFYLNNDKILLPIAIQLFQEKGPDNPVFIPSDPPYTWLLAKMYFNHAEAMFHESCTHLGFTHLIAEAIAVCTHRNLSPSHPIFRLMAPHFFNLIAINALALVKIISPGGWIDRTMTIGRKGTLQLLKKSLKNWKLNVNGMIPNEFSERGVNDPNVLPHYPFRDDSIALYDAIRKYVSKIINHYYENPENIINDWELQQWREELVKDQISGGVGMQGIPGNETGFTKADEIIDVITSIISICSINHAASNFLQYDEYGFIPNYPLSLFGEPPRDKMPLSEKDILDRLPDKYVTSDILTIMHTLSFRGTSSLGNFEIQYLFDPIDTEIVKEFKKDLFDIGKNIEQRNRRLQHPYSILHPKNVPNSISI